MTYEEHLIEVSRNGFLLTFVPMKLRSVEMCCASAKQVGGVVAATPVKHRKAVKTYLRLIGEG